ncbi:EAL domain-containing protein [Dongia sp.]|uniref:EAL domain-containing protein n=1 Tax=Dongia sp. TaxID=1977262 RepID=UPI0035B21E1E
MPAPATDRLREERDRFVGFAFSNADVLLELDETSKVLWAGGAIKSILGIDMAELVGKPLAEILTTADAILLKTALRNLQPGQRRRDLNLVLAQTPDTSHGAGDVEQRLTISTCINRSLKKDLPHYFLSISSAALNAIPHSGARRRDRLTGLTEAVEFTYAASRAVREARKSGKSACLTLLEICEIDELKRVMGSERAESLMAEIGAQLKLHALDPDSAAKLGDGKFGVTHLEDTNPDLIVDAINRVGDNYDLDPATMGAAGKTIQFKGNSLGDDDVESILSYVVGKFSNEGIANFDAGSADQYFKRMTAEVLSRVVAMRDLIHQHRIILHFQPIVHLQDRSPHHYEVLLRFEDGRSPFADVMFAEEINIVHELDLAVAYGAITRIEQSAKLGRDLRLAVNMSARSLLNDNFLNMFDELAGKLGKNRNHLIVEVTESAKLDDLPKAAGAVDRLRSAGHLVCLDDFGAGASSLPYLQQLQVDFVKIDGAYIKSITESLRERAIVQGVLTTCRCLNIKTVAEMIEREDQHKCLLDLGTDLGQGWLYGRPSPEIPLPTVAPGSRVGKRQGVKEQWT